MKSIIVEILLVAVLLVLTVTTLNPVSMPVGMHLAVISALIALFAAFAVFFWREKGEDEREVMLIQKSDRIAFLAGATTLLIIIVYEGVFLHMETPWVLIALTVMVIAKIVGYIYSERRH